MTKKQSRKQSRKAAKVEAKARRASEAADAAAEKKAEKVRKKAAKARKSAGGASNKSKKHAMKRVESRSNSPIKRPSAIAKVLEAEIDANETMVVASPAAKKEAQRTLKRERSLRLKGVVPQPVDVEAKARETKAEISRLHKLLEPRHINRDGIKAIKVIGAGQFGKVYIAKHFRSKDKNDVVRWTDLFSPAWHILAARLGSLQYDASCALPSFVPPRGGREGGTRNPKLDLSVRCPMWLANPSAAHVP